MKRTDKAKGEFASLDELIDQITTDANGDTEQLWAFRQAFEDGIEVPCDATVIGERVQVLRFDFDGNERRGLTACVPPARRHETRGCCGRSGDFAERAERALCRCIS
jgi:hypothetical protein